MKKGTTVTHKMSGCTLEVRLSIGNCVTCIVTHVAENMGAIGWTRDARVYCLKSELEVHDV